MTEHFFIVGAQRSGTTYLYQILDEHPQIEMAKPVRPEPKFFLQADLSGQTPADYVRQFFDPASSAPLRGEKSTSYIESERAARHISAWYPQAKIIFLLRDPITRALSNYQFSRKNGLETAPLEKAICNEAARLDQYDREKVSTSPFAYLQRGRYLDYIRVYGRYFSREQMIFLIYEEFVGQLVMLQALYRALGADPTFEPPSLHEHVNSGDHHVSATPSPVVEQYMHDYFAPLNAELAAYLGRDLSRWSRLPAAAAVPDSSPR